MNRRSFFGRLLVGAGVVAAAPSLNLEAAPVPPPAAPVSTLAGPASGELYDLAREALRLLHSHLPQREYEVEPEYPGIIGRGRLRRQSTTYLSVDSRQNLPEAMKALARLVPADTACFGVLPLPKGGNIEAVTATNVRLGVSLRVARYFCELPHAETYRFDIVHG